MEEGIYSCVDAVAGTKRGGVVAIDAGRRLVFAKIGDVTLSDTARPHSCIASLTEPEPRVRATKTALLVDNDALPHAPTRAAQTLSASLLCSPYIFLTL